MKSLVDSNEENLLRKRKYTEIVKESDFKSLDQVLDKHPTEFTEAKIDSIPLKNNFSKKDKFLEEINTESDIKKYTQSVINPTSGEMKALASRANSKRKELGWSSVA